MLQALAALVLAASSAADVRKDSGPFIQRGYYITMMRMPTYDLADWKRIIQDIHDDGGNTLLLWVAGAFRSRRFPITWAYNQDHENVRHDFVRDLIDYAHTKQVKVLLGFTPFGYDGTNQYPLEHPELIAVARDGQPAAAFGIGCWGRNLCPSRVESQRFMLEYVREMAFEFYPNADGLLIESSDYAICHCPDCGPKFFEKEFAFVRTISRDVWARKPDAMVVVFPHYFSGSALPGFGVKAAKLPFDPRWTLIFTPHSAHLEPALIQQAKQSFWWDDSPALRGPREIQAGARRARDAGVSGYIPSLEAFSFVATVAEEGQAWLKGRRQVPLGFGWLQPGDPPYGELPIRVNRIAYRQFTRDPDLAFDRFRRILGEVVFGYAATPRAIDDLLELQRLFNAGRTWCQPAPVTCPVRVRAMALRQELTAAKRAELREAIARLKAMRARYEGAKSQGERELHRISAWILELWGQDERSLLADDQ